MKRILIAAMLVLVASLSATEAKSSVYVSCERYFYIKFSERSRKVNFYDDRQIEILKTKVIKFTDDLIKFSIQDDEGKIIWNLNRISGKLTNSYNRNVSLDCYKIQSRKF